MVFDRAALRERGKDRSMRSSVCVERSSICVSQSRRAFRDMREEAFRDMRAGGRVSSAGAVR